MSVSKTLTDSSLHLLDAKPLLSQRYFFKPMKNERTIDRIVNNTFEEIDAFSKLIIIFEILNKENRDSHAKYDFRFFLQSALIFPILMRFEKKIFFFQSALTWSQI